MKSEATSNFSRRNFISTAAAATTAGGITLPGLIDLKGKLSIFQNIFSDILLPDSFFGVPEKSGFGGQMAIIVLNLCDNFNKFALGVRNDFVYIIPRQYLEHCGYVKQGPVLEDKGLAIAVTRRLLGAARVPVGAAVSWQLEYTPPAGPRWRAHADHHVGRGRELGQRRELSRSLARGRSSPRREPGSPMIAGLGMRSTLVRERARESANNQPR